MDKFISIKEASELVGVTTTTLRRWEQNGILEKYPDIINNNPLLQNIKYPSVTGNFTPVGIHENLSSDSLKQEVLNV